MPKPPLLQTLSAALLIGGTCIGGGMLALPVATGMGGFLPSILIMALCCFFMTATALLLLEAMLWMPEGAHIISLASRLLGPWGRAVAWILYLFIAYASIVAYIAGAGAQIAQVSCDWLGLACSKGAGALIFTTVFGAVLYFGSIFVGRVNAILFGALVIAYFALIGMGLDEVQPSLLLYRKWSHSWMALPFLLTAFSFQTMLPSLIPYLHSHVRSLRWAVVGGTLLSFCIYAVWQLVILGIVPAEGQASLAMALEKGEPITRFLFENIEGKGLAIAAEGFAFFALTTSFLGMALGLFDFLADGLHIPKGWGGSLALIALIGLPSLLFAIYFERAFVIALDTTGGFGDTILNGLLPVLMVWVGRYHLNYREPWRSRFGKGSLIVIALFFAGVIVFEILSLAGSLPSIYTTIEHFDEQLILPQ